MSRFKFLLSFAVFTASLISSACLWDRDSLWMENQKFPMALELITGKFRRHTKHYYQWRRDDSLKKLKFVEFQFKKELADAQRWYAELEANEKKWAEDGEDLTEKYREIYSESPKVKGKK